MVCRDFILPEDCKLCLFLFTFQFAKLIVPYHFFSLWNTHSAVPFQFTFCQKVFCFLSSIFHAGILVFAWKKCQRKWLQVPVLEYISHHTWPPGRNVSYSYTGLTLQKIAHRSPWTDGHFLQVRLPGNIGKPLVKWILKRKSTRCIVLFSDLVHPAVADE